MVHLILVDTDVLIDAGRAVEVAVSQLQAASQNSTLVIRHHYPNGTHHRVS